MKRMLFRVRFLSLVVFAMFAGVWPMAAQAAATVPAGSPPRMGAALLSFAVLGAATVTNEGNTVITGNLGVSPGTAVTGFPPGTVTGGSIHSNDPVAQQAHADLATAYADAAAAALTSNLTGTDLGTLTLGPGVYKFNSSAQLTGTLHLNGNGVYIFQIGSTLTTASNSAVVLGMGAVACAVFWQVGSSATLGTSTSFMGNILANTSITVTKSVAIDGRALAGAVEKSGAVTLDTNAITECGNPVGCNQGEGNNDNAGSAEAARKASARHDDDDASGTANCDTNDSDQDNKTEDNKTEDNKTEDNKTEGNKTQGNSSQGDSNQGNSTKAETTKAETSKAETSKAETSKAETTQANTTKANTTKANTTKANTTKANATHSNDSHDGSESGSQGG